MTIVLSVVNAWYNHALRFYPGWTFDHTDWQPVGAPYAELVAEGTSSVAQHYFSLWTSPVLAFVIFGLFGVTAEARKSYWRVICALGGYIGWHPTPRADKRRASLGDIEFGERPQDMTLDAEMGYAFSLLAEGVSDCFMTDLNLASSMLLHARPSQPRRAKSIVPPQTRF